MSIWHGTTLSNCYFVVVVVVVVSISSAKVGHGNVALEVYVLV